MLSQPASDKQKTQIGPGGQRFLPFSLQAKELTLTAGAFLLSIALTRFDRQSKSRTYRHYIDMPVNHRLKMSASLCRKTTILEGNRRRLTPGFMGNSSFGEKLLSGIKLHLGPASPSVSENTIMVVSKAAAMIQIHVMSRESLSNERDSFAQKPRSRNETKERPAQPALVKTRT